MTSQIIDDLRIEAVSLPGPQRAGTATSVTLQFFNTGAKPRTIFFTLSETFRFGQSTFRYRARSGPTDVQPMPRDGYVPSESDFHVIPPNDRLVFQQKLLIARTTPSGALTVEWTYQNALDSYPSKMSNGGDPIPGIWRGKLVHEFKVQVTK